MNGASTSLPSLVRGVCEGTSTLAGVEIALCPPFVYLSTVGDLAAASGVATGGQNLATEASGAFTGEVSGEMLLDVGCTYVIVGHSERRSLYGEDNALVAQKFARARECGLVPILCLGESQAQYESGATQAIVGAQLDAVISCCGVQALGFGVIAYEPVWAIGTGLTATPEQAQTVHEFIRGELRQASAAVADATRILYGGSVKPDNAVALFSRPDIDGGLIGGAALDASAFIAICAAAT